MSGLQGAPQRGLRVLAVDDEAPALSELTFLLRQVPQVAEVVAHASGADALRAIGAGHIDAVFLDIRMPGLSGLDLAQVLSRFDAQHRPQIVFVTAYDQHAATAFDLEAVDYLRKPLRPERLQQAVERLCARLAAQAAEHSTGTSRAAPGALASEQPDASRPAADVIAVELGGVTRYLQRSEVVFAETRGDYVRLHTRSGQHLLRASLGSLEQRWAAAGFLRVHRQYLINRAYVEAVRTHRGTLTLDLGGGVLIPVSRRHATAVRESLLRSARIDGGAP